METVFVLHESFCVCSFSDLNMLVDVCVVLFVLSCSFTSDTVCSSSVPHCHCVELSVQTFTSCLSDSSLHLLHPDTHCTVIAPHSHPPVSCSGISAPLPPPPPPLDSTGRRLICYCCVYLINKMWVLLFHSNQSQGSLIPVGGAGTLW